MRNLVVCFLLIFSASVRAQYSSPVVIDTTGPVLVNNILTADFDKDGWKDIVISYYFNELVWYRNLNGNSFSSPMMIDSTLWMPVFADAQDIDGDDVPELLVSADSLDYAKLYYYKYQLLQNTWVKVNVDDSIDVSVVRSFWEDMDQDGDLDIISCHDLKIVTYLNSGGVFSPAFTLITQSEFYNMVVHDFNGDDFPDAVVHSAHGVRLLVNNQNLTVSDSLIINELHGLLETVDLDQDQEYDIVFPDQAISTNCISYLYPGNNQFSLFQSVPLGVSGQNPSLKFNTMNADSFPDVIYIQNFGVGTIPKGIYIRYNNGAGMFGSELLVDSAYQYNYAFTDDMDNDGDLDILWAGSDINGRYLGVTFNQLITDIRTPESLVIASPFPNPTSGVLHLRMPTDTCWQLYSVTGLLLAKGCSSTIDLGDFASGVYCLTMNGATALRIVKLAP